MAESSKLHILILQYRYVQEKNRAGKIKSKSKQQQKDFYESNNYQMN